MNEMTKPAVSTPRSLTVFFALFAICAGARAQSVDWSATDTKTNKNWSDPLNWKGGLLPDETNLVIFPGPGGSTESNVIDNIVDTNFTVAGLFYSQTDNLWCNTLINSNVTLTLLETNISIMLDSGSLSDPPSGLTQCYNTISGAGGTLVVNNTNAASIINVEQGSATYAGDSGQYAILNMSGLDTFDATVGRLLVAVQGNGAGDAGQVNLFDNHRATGWLYLAKTNVINLTQVGNIEGYGGAGYAAATGPALVLCDVNVNFSDFNSYIYLGQSNAIFADTITIGRNQAIHTSFFEFNPDFTAPSQLYLRGESSNRVSEFIIADSTASGNYGNANVLPGGPIAQPPQSDVVGAAGIVDLSAGSADIMIDTLLIGKGFNGAGGGYVAGIFNMGAGTLDVNTLQLGVMSSASGNRPVTGTFAANSANVVVNSNNVALGVKLGKSATAVATGNLNITNGSFNVANGNFGIIDSGQSASEITFAGTVVTAAIIGSSAAPVGTLTIGDTTLNLAVTNKTGSVVTRNMTTDSVSGTNVINIMSISELAGLSPVITLIQSGNAIQGNGSSDFALGTLPAGYSGNLQVTATAVQLILTRTPYTANIWTGADAAAHNTNWSDGLNWSLRSAPNGNGSAVFNNTAAVTASALSAVGGGPGDLVPANVNNVVDAGVTVLELSYANTNGSYQNTYISNNATLTVTVSGLTVGSPVLDLGDTTGNVTISGAAGTLDLTNSSFYVGLGDTNTSSTAQATLDMSGLGAFNASVDNFLVGVSVVGPVSVLQSVGTVYLARSNTITASSGNGSTDSTLVALDIGDAGDAETTAGYGNKMGSSVYLGWTNTLFADYISVGRQWASGGLFFNPAFVGSHPTVTINGASTNTVTLWNIGDGAQSTLSAGKGSGTNDFTGGTVDAWVDTLQIGIASSNSLASGSGAETGILTFDAGTITADTVNISYNPAFADGNVYDCAVGTVNVNGTGALIVTNILNLAYAGGPVQSAPSATLNINGGAVWANTLVPGAYSGSSPDITTFTTSIINLNGGSLTVTNGGIGSATAPLTSLNLTNGTIAVGTAALPLINAENINLSGTNTLQVLSLPAIEIYPVTITIATSGSAIAGSLTNLKAVFPAGYVVKNVSEGPGATAILVTFSSGPITSRGNVYWNGPDAANGDNINWTDTNNWLLPPPPSPIDTAVFDNTGESAFPGFVAPDNIVDTNFGIAGLWYAETNVAPNYSYHNTMINPGVTLTVFNTNASIMLDCGTQTDPAGAAGATTCYSTISGAGTLIVSNTNSASLLVVSQGSSTYAGALGPDNLYASLDMSGLNMFEATVGRLLLGIQGVSATLPGQVPLLNAARQAGIMYLAETNIVNLTQVGNIQGTGPAAAGGPALVLNDVVGFGDFPSQLFLGQSNAIFADTITVGRSQCSRTAVFEFNTNFTPPFQLYLRGESSNRVSEMIVADNTENGGFGNAAPGSGIVPPDGFNVGSAGLVDLSAGTSDIMVDTLLVGKGYGNAGGGYAEGIFNMGAGTLNVNSLGLGVMSATNGSAPAIGMLTVFAGGSVAVNGELALGSAIGGGTSAFAYGGLNVGGTVTAGSISSGGHSSIVITNGTLALNSPGGFIGTAAAPIGSISLGNSTLNLAVGGSSAAVITTNLTFTGTNDLINITDLPLIAGVPSTVTLIQQLGSAIVGSDFVLGSLPDGYDGTLQMSSDGTEVQLKVTTIPRLPPKGATISGINLQPAGSNLVITGTNGLPNTVYYVLVSTNLPVWTPIATNTFDANGNFSITLPYSPNTRDSFYALKYQ